MLKMGVEPKVASATSAVMIMYTAFTATTSYYVFGLITMDYAPVRTNVGTQLTIKVTVPHGLHFGSKNTNCW